MGDQQHLRIMPRICPSFPVLLLQHMLSLATGCTTMWKLLSQTCSASKGAVKRRVSIKIFSLKPETFPSFHVLLLLHLLLAVVHMLLCCADMHEEAVLLIA